MNKPTKELAGHVTSIAVLHEYRRKGLAGVLMNQLHAHLEQSHGASGGVGLHVRQSNRAATNLYQNFGYQVHDCILHYYQDGEDAYYMKKDLFPPLQLQQQRRYGGRFWNSRPKVWEDKNSLVCLPRTVYDFDAVNQKQQQQEKQHHPQAQTAGAEEQVAITGT